MKICVWSFFSFRWNSSLLYSFLFTPKICIQTNFELKMAHTVWIQPTSAPFSACLFFRNRQTIKHMWKCEDTKPKTGNDIANAPTHVRVSDTFAAIFHFRCISFVCRRYTHVVENVCVNEMFSKHWDHVHHYHYIDVVASQNHSVCASVCRMFSLNACVCDKRGR